MTQPFPNGAQLVAYLRDSGGASQERSVAQQEAVIREWAEREGYLITRVFADVARSGTTTVGREQFDALQVYFDSNPEEAGIVFWDYSRWSRNYNDGAYFLASLRRRGYQAYSLDEQVPAGPAGRMIEAYYLASAEDFSRKLGRAVKRGQADKARRYKTMPHGETPAGYRRVPVVIEGREERTRHRLDPDPVTGPLVTKAFRMRADGYSYREINNEVQLHQTAQGYSAMFRNTIYIGTLKWGDLMVSEFCEPLTDLDTWQRVQDRSIKDRMHPRQETSPYLLSGLLMCAECGSWMTGTVTRSHGYEYRYYRCTRATGYPKCSTPHIREVEAEAVVFERIKDYLTDPILLAKTVESLREQRARSETEQEAKQQHANDELQSVRRQIQNITLAIAEGGELRALVARLSDLEKREAELVELVASAAPRPVVIPTIDDLADFGAKLWNAFEAAERREKQLLLRSLVDAVYLVKTDEGLSGRVVLRALPGEEEVTYESEI